ncbi:hypothetical protein [Metapseudomonas furukawaii]
MKIIYSLICFAFFYSPWVFVFSDEIKPGGESGSIVFLGKTYRDITGSKDGFYRELMSINGEPALFSGNRDSLYFPLKLSNGMLLIDCVYVDSRNMHNGARVFIGVCGLGRPLNSEYSSIAYEYSDRWIERVFSFDTSTVFREGKPTSFLLGKIGDIGIYNRYSSVEALEGATPEIYIKSDRGCYSFGEIKAFLVFNKGDEKQPSYLDVLRSHDPMVLQRLQAEDLRNIAIDKCHY